MTSKSPVLIMFYKCACVAVYQWTSSGQLYRSVFSRKKKSRIINRAGCHCCISSSWISRCSHKPRLKVHWWSPSPPLLYSSLWMMDLFVWISNNSGGHWADMLQFFPPAHGKVRGKALELDLKRVSILRGVRFGWLLSSALYSYEVQ